MDDRLMMLITIPGADVVSEIESLHNLAVAAYLAGYELRVPEYPAEHRAVYWQSYLSGLHASQTDTAR